MTGIFKFGSICSLVCGNLRAVSVLHNRMLNKVMSAPINLYFDITPIGQIMNRFSKDLNVMDASIVFAISGLFGCVFNAMASIIVAVYVVPYIIVALALMMLIGVIIFRYCLEGYN